MIGVVLVSHSAGLANGVREMAQQMTGDTVKIAAAGGVDDPENPIGTDAMRVHAAIEEVYSDDGVIVLMDLGSALMSAEMALEFLDPAKQENVRLCDAPFVEGALSAAIQASGNSTIDEVMAAARGALAAKQQHLAPTQGGEPAPSEPVAETLPDDDTHTLTVTVPNKMGLHARPAARLVRLVGNFDGRLAVQKGDKRVNASNMNQVALLDARRGDDLTFFADGNDADAILRAVQALVDDNFGDRDKDDNTAIQDSRPKSNAPDNVSVGVGAARGLAIGRVFMMNHYQPDLPDHTVDNTEVEIERLQKAIQDASVELEALSGETGRKLGNADASIFEAQGLILQDASLVDEATEHIRQQQQPAETAWWAVIEAIADQYRAAASEVLQARAADVLDVGRRVLCQLSPCEEQRLDVPAGSILTAPDLSPSDTARLNPDDVRGIVTQYGGATSHTAIIARGLGIPAVVGLGEAYTELMAEQQIVIDGEKGWVYTAPSSDKLDEFKAQIKQQQTERERLLQASKSPAITTDDHQVEVAANIGDPSETADLADVGAEGVGLFRTELLFMGRPAAPDEDQQAEAYRRAAENLNGQPLIIRMLDVGGDKAIDYIDIAPEENPFLGHRGVRYWLDNKPLALTQLRAACRASTAGNVRVMFPMVGTLDELRAAKALLQEAQAALNSEGVPYDADMQIGMMIEVPAAVMGADLLAPHVDFFSIGTNDLTQYIMAADRGNAKVNALANPFQPAVLRAIKQVVNAAHDHGKWVGMCGEMAGNPLATRLLVGLGLDELSMSAPSIPEVKAIIRQTSYADARAMAARVLDLQTAEEVMQHLRKNMD